MAWLTEQTDKPYRLPNEAEWEYACRAGTTTRYSWGDAITPEDASYGQKAAKTIEVGSYPANSWHLYDMHGNVWEWVEDYWNDSYVGAPANGTAWTTGKSGSRVLRGGFSGNDPSNLRSADRLSNGDGNRDFGVGFRVARTLR